MATSTVAIATGVALELLSSAVRLLSGLERFRKGDIPEDEFMQLVENEDQLQAKARLDLLEAIQEAENEPE